MKKYKHGTSPREAIQDLSQESEKEMEAAGEGLTNSLLGRGKSK